jgi:hypothetical protein
MVKMLISSHLHHLFEMQTAYETIPNMEGNTAHEKNTCGTYFTKTKILNSFGKEYQSAITLGFNFVNLLSPN